MSDQAHDHEHDADHDHTGHSHESGGGHTHDITVKKVERLGATKVKLVLEISAKNVAEHEEMTAKSYANKARLPGFRPGKAPLSMVKQKFQDEIRRDMISHLVESGVYEGIQKSNLVPINRPNISIKQLPFGGAGKTLEFEAEFEVEPTIELKKYKGVPLTAVSNEVSEEDITNTLDGIRERMSVLEPSDSKKAAKGEFAVAEIGFEFPELPEKNEARKSYTVEVGAGKIFTELDEALMQMSIGEERKIEGTFPADYTDKKLAGKKVIYDAKLLEVKKKNLPPADDALAAQLKEGATLETLKTEIRDSLKQAKEEENSRAQRAEILDYLVKNHNFEVPASLVESQAKSLLQWMEQDMKGKGMPVAKWKENELKDIRDRAEKMVRHTLLLKEIAVKENIVLDEAKLQNRIDEVAVQMNRTADEAKKVLSGRGILDRLRDEILTDQIFGFLVSNAKIDAKKA